MIEVSDLTKTYPGVAAVDRISFKVEKGEIAGFLGPNGAGKSTTMRILTCFIAPTSGSATVAGFDVVRQSMEVRRRVGYLPENNPLYTEMRVEEYLQYRARVKGVPRSERQKRVDEVLERVSLQDRRRSIIQHLSKGLRQRVGLADAIVHNPEIVILDEPTIGLDPMQVREIRELIRQLGQGHTVLFSSHILSEVEKVCGRVLIIHRGKLVEQGTPEEIANRMMKTGRVRLEIRGDGRAIKEALDRTPGVARILWSSKGDLNTYIVEAADGKDLRGDLFRYTASQGWEVLELSHERLSLEEVFTAITETAARGAGA
ncbi:MAG TPA: ATP-binding cassette domain-containing protein [Planctomycetota bacterium]|nr:ATP-binding cassette domain-containing protein [Planctomycetota bacterium]